jgi:hypothetical protein
MDEFTDIFMTATAATPSEGAPVDLPIDEDTKIGYGSGMCTIS